MRRNILHAGAANLRYEIREIVGTANEIRALGQEITWENIGDPVAKGEAPPEWICEIVASLLEQPSSWAYCETRGVQHVREFLAAEVNRRDGVGVTPEDIVFFNGLGDAVAKVYGFLSREARVLGPSPAYSTHSSAEAAHSGYSHVTYGLDPYNGWLPDVRDMRNNVKYNDSIAGILLLSPDNPTGAVYPREILEEIAQIAREHDIFIIADEIYAKHRLRRTRLSAHERVDRRRAGHRHARDQQGVSVARRPLWLARGAQQGPGPDVRALH